MKKLFLIFLFILFGLYSIFNGLGILSLRYDILSFTIKLIWIGAVFFMIFKLKINPNFKTFLIIVFLPIVFFISKLQNSFKFLPTAFGTYELHAIYYMDNSISPKSQDRIEYYTKEYGLNNTAKKYESVNIYIGFIELRKEIYATSSDEINSYKHQKWIKKIDSP